MNKSFGKLKKASVLRSAMVLDGNIIVEIIFYTTQVSEKTPELERLWTDVKGKLNKVVEDINAQIPNAGEQLNQLQTKLQEGLQVVVQESDKTAKAVSKNSEKVQEDIAKLTKQAVELAVQTTQNLNTQLQQAAKTS